MPSTGRIAAAVVAGTLALLLSACSAQPPVSLASGAGAGTTSAPASSQSMDTGTELSTPTSPAASSAAATPRSTAGVKKAATKAPAASKAAATASPRAASPKAASPKAASVRPTASSSSTATPTRRATPTPTVAGGSGAGAGGTSSSADEAAVIQLTNVERAKNGCGPLTAVATLTTVARAHSKDMAVNRFFDHNSQDGRTPFDRMKTAGYTYSMAAENIAAGQPTPASVVAAWMNSPGHRANIVNCKLTQIGVGAYRLSGSPYGVYWTQDFGTPR